MSDNIAHTETIRGYRIDIIHDEDCTTPREATDCNLGLFVVDDSRGYGAPDSEAPKLPETFPCAADEMVAGEDHENCADCQGTGEVEATFGHLKRWAAAEYGATTVLGLSGPHDWAGRWKVHDHDDADADVRGIIFDTAEQIAKTGCPLDIVDRGLRSEVTEYNDWADGNCYGFRVTDVNGDEIEACWGFIGDPTSYVLEEARQNVPDVESVQTYPVRLTSAQVAAIIDALEATELGAMFLDAAEKAGVPDSGDDE